MARALAVTALAAGPLLLAPPAYADDGRQDGPNWSRTDNWSPTGNQTVDFTGGSLLSMLLCRSEPSVSRLTVPAESRVMFVNRLGQNAMLRVNGKPMVQVGPDRAVPVLFHYGPVSVSMTFSCGAGVVAQFSSTSVSVTPAGRPEAPRDPAPRPTVAATAQPTPSPSAKARRGAPAPAQPGTGALATVTADLPPASRSRAAVAPSTAAPSGTAPASAALSAAGASPDSGKGANAVAVEPLVRVSGMPRETSPGVLALIAAAFVVGVTIAVIRAIIAKRTILTHQT